MVKMNQKPSVDQTLKSVPQVLTSDTVHSGWQMVATAYPWPSMPLARALSTEQTGQFIDVDVVDDTVPVKEFCRGDGASRRGQIKCPFLSFDLRAR